MPSPSQVYTLETSYPISTTRIFKKIGKSRTHYDQCLFRQWVKSQSECDGRPCVMCEITELDLSGQQTLEVWLQVPGQMELQSILELAWQLAQGLTKLILRSLLHLTSNCPKGKFSIFSFICSNHIVFNQTWSSPTPLFHVCLSIVPLVICRHLGQILGSQLPHFFTMRYLNSWRNVSNNPVDNPLCPLNI